MIRPDLAIGLTTLLGWLAAKLDTRIHEAGRWRAISEALAARKDRDVHHELTAWRDA